jgi:hypothetical protein
MSKEAMKVEGPIHVVCQCDKCKAKQEQGEPTEVRLWDSQWTNVVNHDNCYQGWSKEDAINHAVKMTENYIASNVANNKLPQQRKPLTDVLLHLFQEWKEDHLSQSNYIDAVEQIKAAHGIKGKA